jgi:hypothetical protein
MTSFQRQSIYGFVGADSGLWQALLHRKAARGMDDDIYSNAIIAMHYRFSSSLA